MFKQIAIDNIKLLLENESIDVLHKGSENFIGRLGKVINHQKSEIVKDVPTIGMMSLFNISI